ncbi:NAD(P)H-quinone oxidoreductase subunit O - like 1 [Theobroma cacao]|nr:NAD(P)H-quinone oxidoreductase subunit O - like 1 [Theobroma cacao]
MAFSAAAVSHASFSCLSSFPQTLRRRNHLRFSSIRLIKAAAEPEKEKATTTTQTKNAEGSSNAQPQTPAAQPRPKKPVYSMKKGQIVRVDKEKYLNSVNGIPLTTKAWTTYMKTAVLDLRNFETGEYALVAWVGIPTAPAWLPTDMLIKYISLANSVDEQSTQQSESEKLDYERL